MSKEIEWSKFYGEGTVVCYCDTCQKEEQYDFDNNRPPYNEIQNELRKKGWLSCKVHGNWHDFCSEECRNKYIKEH